MGPPETERTVQEREGEAAGLDIFWREAPGDEPPVLYLHGVPTSSQDWLPFLRRTGGVAPDLPGFGRSAKRGDLDYSIPGYDRFLEAFLDALGVGAFRLVVHDWGAVGLALAQRFPERVRRLVVIDAVPFLPGYRWHPVARIWRRRGLGELAMGLTTRWGMRLVSRGSGPWSLPRELIDPVWEHFDHGTQRAILALYRSAPPEVLEAAGARLEAIDAPALVLWGEREPYIPPAFADAYAERLPRARARRVDGAGHWPWLDRPELVDEVARFLEAEREGEV